MDQIEPDHLFALFTVVEQTIRHSSSIEFVNEGFSLAEELLSLETPPMASIDNLLNATMQGRLVIFKRAPPYNFDAPQFHFYTFLAAFVRRFPARSPPLIRQLSLWLPRVSGSLLPALLKVLNRAIKESLVDAALAKEMQKHLFRRVEEEECEFEHACPMVLFVLGLRARFRFPAADLVVFLERIWNGNHHDPSVLEFLAPIFLATFAEPEFEFEGELHIFGEITNIVLSEEAELDYAQVCGYYVAMYDNEVPFESFEPDAALVFAHFLVKNPPVLAELRFSHELLRNMHRCMKQIFRFDKRCLRMVERHWENDPAAVARIQSLNRAPELRDL
jgi:hypothetical protein